MLQAFPVQYTVVGSKLISTDTVRRALSQLSQLTSYYTLTWLGTLGL